MKLVHSLILSVLLCAVMLGGCASQQMQGTPEALKEERVCINVRQIYSLDPIDDRHILARLGAANYYLMTVEDRCRGLGFAGGATLVNPSMRVCGDGSDFISFQNMDEPPRRCRIVQIEAVESKKAAMGLIEARTPPRQRD